ncbi:hypothetical protein [Leptolinea tardivitalis]|uniref:Uncharacterized protein n=1 Tax=Leptolinea tardivitalis TaxID=229920 RepID=A0A0N8GLU0_9CHLR|nr:hypothetical protein [Leptolinea tardivitalis]KPL73434.1 hypothetical protein ADM99_04355 [Leptolinea tardivitalis]GAP21592.1 hypothetical protein LTAR_01803 [Leptolinea tardivitalis]
MDILAGELFSANLSPLDDEEVTAKGRVPRQKQVIQVASIAAVVLLILPACIFMVSILINMLTGNN